MDGSPQGTSEASTSSKPLEAAWKEFGRYAPGARGSLKQGLCPAAATRRWPALVSSRHSVPPRRAPSVAKSGCLTRRDNPAGKALFKLYNKDAAKQVRAGTRCDAVCVGGLNRCLSICRHVGPPLLPHDARPHSRSAMWGYVCSSCGLLAASNCASGCPVHNEVPTMKCPQ